MSGEESKQRTPENVDGLSRPSAAAAPQTPCNGVSTGQKVATAPAVDAASSAAVVVHLSDTVTIIRADCLDVLPTLRDVDAVVCDPPYGLSFMGKHWDYDVPPVDTWKACNYAMKPGAHLLAFAGTRTQHRMAVRIEDAGFEIRDMIAWVYGSGFPKSLDVSKAIDKAAGAEREVVGYGSNGMGRMNQNNANAGYRPNPYSDGVDGVPITAPATDAAKQWHGWGTALKPALEPITVARKPLDGTVAENVLKHGTGALNIDACRVGIDGGTAKGSKPKGAGNGIYGAGLHGACEITKLNAGRFPANLIHDGSDEVLALFPDTTSGMMKAGQHRRNSIGKGGYHGNFPDEATGIDTYGDSGSAARFFYCAKVSRSERGDDNHHPTVKPVDLMCYLVRLVCRAGGTVLDPFMGSGTTGIACIREGMKFIGIERDEHYFEIARKRLEAELAQGLLPLNDNQP